jgi:predicted ATPase
VRDGGRRTEGSDAPSFVLRPSSILGLLASLVDKSLVVADEQDGEVRYHLLETIRQYAAGELLDGGSTRWGTG